MFPGRVNIRDVSDGDLSLFASRGCGNNGGSVPAKQTLASVAPEQVGLCQRLREVVSRKELCRSDVITGRGACGHLLQVDGELAGVEGTTFAEFLPGDDNFIPRFHTSSRLIETRHNCEVKILALDMLFFVAILTFDFLVPNCV
jgi:hypothetical protein